MKNISWFLILFFTVNIIYCQKSKKGIKKIIETEMNTYSQDGIRYNNKVLINETNYNSEGKEITNTREIFDIGKPYRTIVTNYIYDEDGKILNKSAFILEDSIQFTFRLIYENNKLIKESTNYMSEEKNIAHEEVYKYNEKGKRIESYYRYSEKYKDSSEYLRYLKATTLYDKKERAKIIDWRESDSTFKYNKYKYFRNRKGFLTKEKEYDINNNLVKTLTFNYEFDDKGNWTLFRTYENNIMTEFVFREIEYY